MSDSFSRALADQQEDIYQLGIKALVRNVAGEILLLQVNPAKLHNPAVAYWDLPGGRVQKGMTVLETLAREVEEETGATGVMNAQEVAMVLSNIRIPVGDGSTGLILAVYSCQIPAGAPIVLSDEHLAFAWHTPAKASRLLAVKYPANFCERIAQLGS